MTVGKTTFRDRDTRDLQVILTPLSDRSTPQGRKPLRTPEDWSPESAGDSRHPTLNSDPGKLVVDLHPRLDLDPKRSLVPNPCRFVKCPPVSPTSPPLRHRLPSDTVSPPTPPPLRRRLPSPSSPVDTTHVVPPDLGLILVHSPCTGRFYLFLGPPWSWRRPLPRHHKEFHPSPVRVGYDWSVRPWGSQNTRDLKLLGQVLPRESPSPPSRLIPPHGSPYS